MEKYRIEECNLAWQLKYIRSHRLYNSEREAEKDIKNHMSNSETLDDYRKLTFEIVKCDDSWLREEFRYREEKDKLKLIFEMLL